MAVIAPELESPGARQVTWTPIAGGDTCTPIGLSGYNDKTVTITGTVTTFALQGSNDLTNWFTLNDIDMTTPIDAAGMFTIKENPLWIRPLLTTGSGVTVILSCV